MARPQVYALEISKILLKSYIAIIVVCTVVVDIGAGSWGVHIVGAGSDT